MIWECDNWSGDVGERKRRAKRLRLGQLSFQEDLCHQPSKPKLIGQQLHGSKEHELGMWDLAWGCGG